MYKKICLHQDKCQNILDFRKQQSHNSDLIVVTGNISLHSSSHSKILVREERAGLSLLLRSSTSPPKYFPSPHRKTKLKQLLFPSLLSSRREVFKDEAN